MVKQLFSCIIFRVSTALITSCFTVGMATAFAPNYNKAVLGAARIFKLLDKVPLIDSTGITGHDIVRKMSLLILKITKMFLFNFSRKLMETLSSSMLSSTTQADRLSEYCETCHWRFTLV